MKLPRGGTSLLVQREQGMHPARAWVICGADQSRKPRNEPCLSLGADDDPAKLDWSVLAGLAVHVVARDGFVDAVYRLVALVAAVAAPVIVHWRQPVDDWPYQAGKGYRVDANEVLFCSRHAGVWCYGWSEVANQDYESRKWVYRRAQFVGVLGEWNL